MDLLSGLAVQLLELTPTDDLLDLCCAPGMKLSLAACLMQNMEYKCKIDSRKNMDEPLNEPNSLKRSITGVDVSLQRLHTSKSLLRKYRAQNTRLFHQDACLFEQPVYHVYKKIEEWKSHSALNNLTCGKLLDATINGHKKCRPFFETCDLRKFPGISTGTALYSKVLWSGI